MSEVKSAMQMTAFKDGTKEDGSTPWDWDDVGHGRVDLTKAALSGLVMDESIANYLAADPSLGRRRQDPEPAGREKSFLYADLHVRAHAAQYAGVLHPAGRSRRTAFNPDLDLQVSPSTFSSPVTPKETVTLTITASPQTNLTSAIEFGQIILTEDGDLAPDAHLTVAISRNRSAGSGNCCGSRRDFESVGYWQLDLRGS